MTTYRIKPPDWQEHRYDTGQAYAYADTPLGHLSVGPTPKGSYLWNCRGVSGIEDDYESAKSAAESWYRAKMCEGLEDVAS